MQEMPLNDSAVLRAQSDALWKALKDADVVALEAILKEVPSDRIPLLESFNKKRVGPVEWTLRYRAKYPHLTLLLINAGFDVSIRLPCRHTALSLALKKSQREIFDRLTAKGVKANGFDIKRLMERWLKGKEKNEIDFQRLIDAGASLFIQDPGITKERPLVIGWSFDAGPPPPILYEGLFENIRSEWAYYLAHMALANHSVMWEKMLTCDMAPVADCLVAAAANLGNLKAINEILTLFPDAAQKESLRPRNDHVKTHYATLECLNFNPSCNKEGFNEQSRWVILDRLIEAGFTFPKFDYAYIFKNGVIQPKMECLPIVQYVFQHLPQPENGGIELLKRMESQGLRLDEKKSDVAENGSQDTLMHILLRRASYDFALQVLRHFPNYSWETPDNGLLVECAFIYNASRVGSLGVDLLKYGFKSTFTNKNGDTPLHILSQRLVGISNRFELGPVVAESIRPLVYELLKRGASLEDVNGKGETVREAFPFWPRKTGELAVWESMALDARMPSHHSDRGKKRL